MNRVAGSLKSYPSPWSPAARDDPAARGSESLQGLAKSEAYRRLADEIVRYARGEVSGRSFLVAGHRGAGKTTAVLAAMQKAYNDCEAASELDPLRRCRPLLVRLHGPSLLIEVESASKQAGGAGGNSSADMAKGASAASPSAAPGSAPPAEPVKAAGASAEGAPVAAPSGAPAATPRDASAAAAKEDPGLTFSERFLKEMAAGIFPALIDEVRRQLLRRAAASEQSAEMIAHTCDELAQGMTLADLREMFRRLGLLESGLLGKVDAFQELTAINAAVEAYLVVTGKLDTDSNLDVKMALTEERKTSVALAGETLVKTLTPLATAAAVAFGVSTARPAAAAVMAAGVIVSGLAYTMTTTRSRSRAAARTRSFKRDNTHDSLVRRVPLLVEQLRQVGFSPIFVLDEIDKLPDELSAKLLSWLLRNLKSYVTERAFICFVVERKYYEDIVRRPANADAATRYPAEHTFYSDMTYVVPTAAAFHTYLSDVMREGLDASGRPEVDSTAGLRPLQRAWLRHVILHRSRMHAYDLRRELQRAVDRGELQRIEAGSPALVQVPSAWLYHALMQLCIEWVLSEALLRMAVADDPYLIQQQYDILYGVSDAWLGTKPLEPPLAGCLPPPLLAARQHLERFLKDPRQLLEDIHHELDLDRLEVFFAGESQPDRSAIADARADIKIRLDPDDDALPRLSACFATRKYALLQTVTGEAVRPMLGPDGVWIIGTFGYPTSQATVNPVDESRFSKLAELRKSYKDLGYDATFGDFAAIWDLVDAQGRIPIGLLDLALLRRDKNPDEPATIQTLDTYALVIPRACQFVKVLLVGISVLQAIRPQPAASALARLSGWIQGTNAPSRTKSAAQLILGLAEEHQVGFPEKMKVVLDRAAEGGLADDWHRIGERTDLSPGALDPTVRARWENSFAERLLAMVEEGPKDPAYVDASGRKLDIAAELNDWFPAALTRYYWPSPGPRQWPIVVYSALLAEPADKVPPWLRAFAAARLRLRSHLAEALKLAQPSAPSGDGVGRLLSWASKEEDALRHGVIHRVLLVNPDTVMRTWRPAPGFGVLSVRDEDPRAEDFSKRYQPLFDVIISETEAFRPRGLPITSYFVVEPARPPASASAPQASSSVVPWRRLSDDTVVLPAPESLEAAVQAFLGVFPSSSPT